MSAEPILGTNEIEEAQHALEERVGRLEAAVAALQEQQARQASAAVRAGNPILPQTKVGSISPADETGTAAEDSVHPRRSWLLADLFADLKAIPRMFLDIRYRVAWSTWLLVLLVVPLILTSGWWFPLAWAPVVGDYLDKAFDFVLAFILYKALGREARRYRETFRGG